MEKKFSKSWIGSRQPRKQKKYRANAPLNIKRKLMSANLDKELRKKYGRRNIPLRKGDSVKIMRGNFKKRTGKIGSVDLKKAKVSVEGIQRTKKDGSKINIWFAPSNLQIKELNLEDSKRRKLIERTMADDKKTGIKEENIKKTKEKENAPKKK